MDQAAMKQWGRAFLKVRQGFLWFLRFVSVILLVVMLGAAFQWKLPWKFTAALALVPAAGVVIPRKWLLWLWLIPPLAMAGLYLWVQLPAQSSGRWAVYQFSPQSELSDASPIPAADNAAVRYEQVLQDYGDSIFGHQFMDERTLQRTFSTPWTAAEFPQTAMWLRTFETGIDTLIAAGRMERCRFSVPPNLKATHVQMRRINRMKGWARLLLRASNLDLGEGRLDAAVTKQRAVLDMAQHLYDQKTLFDQTGGFDLELLASRGLETTIIDHIDDPNRLASLEAAFLALDNGWAKTWPAIVEREKLLAKNLAGLFYEVNDAGRTRISHTAMYALQEGLGYQPRRLFLRQHEMSRLAVIGLWLSLPVTPDGAAALIDRRFDYFSLQTQKGSVLEYIPPQNIWQMGLNWGSAVDWLAMQQVKYFWALDGQAKRHDALANLIRIFAALKRDQLQQGHWPASLAELDLAPEVLFDPVHNRPFVYQPTGDGFRLYSTGPNGIDDGGLNAPNDKKDDIVFWPRGAMDPAIQDPGESPF